ncbi:hypothetical protein [Tranquillimonas alkanivorans]|uniref:Uncharacterized protein n=1 Tax=Tranquillimonas alkanivorans TaxID=441119 RepID=A0A1I5V239_9RHOB|nr:hypothetical protein [Tranquillimonas alkanivorans]SFQ01016.1 hypothetical protein SAMN04488047_1262 [Tranquillimonas alkanivorans]
MSSDENLKADALKEINSIFARNGIDREVGRDLASEDVSALRKLIATLKQKRKAGATSRAETADYGLSIGIREMLMSGHLEVAGHEDVETIAAAEFRRAEEDARRNEAARQKEPGGPAPDVAVYRSKIYSGRMRVVPDTAPPKSVRGSVEWIKQKSNVTPLVDPAHQLVILRLRAEGMNRDEAETRAKQVLEARGEDRALLHGSDALVVARSLHAENDLTEEEKRAANSVLRKVVTGDEAVLDDEPDVELPTAIGDRRIPAEMTPAEAGAVRANLVPGSLDQFSQGDRDVIALLERGIFSGKIKVSRERSFGAVATREASNVEQFVQVADEANPVGDRLAAMIEDDNGPARAEELERRLETMVTTDREEEAAAREEASRTTEDGLKALQAMGIRTRRDEPAGPDEVEARIAETMRATRPGRETVSGRVNLTPEADKLEAIDAYVNVLRSWEMAANAGEADAVQYLLDRRLACVETLRSMGAINSAFLSGRTTGLNGDLALYLAADIEEIDTPEKGSPQWTDRKERLAAVRDRLRSGLETHVPANRWNPNSNGGIAPEHFAELTRRAADLIANGEEIGDQRRVVEIMRNEVVAHSFHGQFIMDVLAETDESDQSAKDELLAGFGWSRAIRDDNNAELEAVPMSEAVKAGMGSETGIEKLRQFQRIHALGKEIETNPPAVIALHEHLKGDDWAWNIARAGLIEQRFDKSILAEYRRELSKEEIRASGLKGRKADDPVRVFASAYQRFLRDFELGDERMALAMNAMRVSAKKILEKSEDIKALSDGNNELMAALLEFSGDREAELRQESEQVFGSSLRDLVEKQGLAGAPVRNFSKDADAAFNSGDDLVFEAVSGDAVRIARSREELEAGEGQVYSLAGLVAPPSTMVDEKGQERPVLTKDGEVNAGQESLENLAGLLSRFDRKHLSVEILESKSGEKCAQITLPGGRTLADEQIRMGYGLVRSGFGDTDRRHENLAKRSRSEKKGLHAHGFPEVSGSWRSQDGTPKLSLAERRDRISNTVFNYFAPDVRTAAEMLRRPETRFMALPLKAWSAGPVMEREMRGFVRENPERAIEMYEESCSMLDELYQKKQEKGLRSRERYATDYVNRGRAMIGAALAAENEYDLSDPTNPKSFEQRSLEDLKKYPSLTEEARIERRERWNQRMKDAAEKGEKAVRAGFREAGRMADSVMSIGEGLV